MGLVKTSCVLLLLLSYLLLVSPPQIRSALTNHLITRCFLRQVEMLNTTKAELQSIEMS